MARPRIPLRNVKEILRLKHECGLSERQIATSCKVSRSTVADYLSRACEHGISWPLPEGLTDELLEEKLFSGRLVRSECSRPVPDWKEVHLELSTKGVTLMLLWQEYLNRYPDGYSYSRFCELYRAWNKPFDARMRQHHKAGEKLFVDWSGLTADVINPATGEVRNAEIFVAVMGASNHTYAEATFSQSLPDWIGAHKRAFLFYGGVPKVVVPDNLKVGVTKANYYEPEINRTYAEMAHHYGVAILPTRTSAPRDKAPAEKGVQDIQRRILAPLRHRQFFSLEELNEAIGELLDRHNNQIMQRLGESRRSLFEKLDKPKLRSLPTSAYVYAEWKKAKVGPDYHITVEEHHYSVPHTHIRRTIDVRVTQTTVECYYKSRRIAVHQRSSRKGQHTTVAAHMPKHHRAWAEWTPERIIRWAKKTGDATADVVAGIMASRKHPEQGFRACLGIMRLAKSYGAKRCEAACKRALAIGSLRYRSVESILKRGLDQIEWNDTEEPHRSITHDNIRGPRYYN